MRRDRSPTGIVIHFSYNTHVQWVTFTSLTVTFAVKYKPWTHQDSSSPRVHVRIQSQSLLIIHVRKLWRTHSNYSSPLRLTNKNLNDNKVRLLLFMTWRPSRDNPASPPWIQQQGKIIILRPNNNICTRLFVHTHLTVPHYCSIWCSETHSWLCPPQAGILNLTFYKEDFLKAPTHQEWSYRDPDASACTLTEHVHPPFSSLAPGSISPPKRIKSNCMMNSKMYLVGDFFFF